MKDRLESIGFQWFYIENYHYHEIELKEFPTDIVPDREYLESIILVIPYTWSGDYVGGSVERANREYFSENYDVIGIGNGSYSSDYAHVNAYELFRNRQLMEEIESLADYPCISDDKHSYVEMEMESDDWKNWIEHDLRSELVKLAVPDSDENDQEEIEAIEKIADIYDNMSSEKLQELYHRAKEKTNTYWHSESGNGGYVDVEKIASYIWDQTNVKSLEKFVNC